MFLKIFISLCFGITINHSKAQSYISIEYLEIVEYSVEFYYSNNTYHYSTPASSYGNVLSTMQGRFDYYHAIISEEYGKLQNLTMVNETNQATLQEFRNQRLQFIYNAGSTWDLSKTSNANQIINYCCEIYTYPGVAAELKLLRNMSYEIGRLKYANPNTYYTSDRYKELGDVLTKLKTCPSSEIHSLAWNNGLQ